MTSEEYVQRIDDLIKDLPSMHANLLVGIANGAIRTIKHRIQISGMDANGSRFRPYSEWYNKYKTEQRKNKGFTDFSFSNRMWDNIQLIKERSTSEIAVITAMDKGQPGGNYSVPVKTHKRKGIVIKATSKSVKSLSNYEKLESNTKAFGTILDLSKAEIEDLGKDYDNGILEIFRAHGL